jgi:hypothetical protein
MDLTNITWDQWSDQTWDDFAEIRWDMADIYWKNASGNNWNTAGNWFTDAAATVPYGSVPNSGSHVIAYATGVTQTVTQNAVLSFAADTTCSLVLDITGTVNAGIYTAAGSGTNAAGGTVNGGVFSGASFTNGTSANIYGGVFTGANFTNNGTIRQGFITGAGLTNNNNIFGGWFIGGTMTNASGKTIYGGVVNGTLTNSGTVAAAVQWWAAGRITVGGTTYTASGTKPAAITNPLDVTTDNGPALVAAQLATDRQKLVGIPGPH